MPGKRFESTTFDGTARRPALAGNAGSDLSLIEAERHHLAQELHDETAQILTATLFQIDACAAQLGPEHAAVRAQLSTIRDTLKTATREIHHLVYSLRPPVLAELGLEPALRWLVQSFQSRFGIEVTFNPSDCRRLSINIETALFRVVQEALTNVARHARARTVVIDLGMAASSVTCSVRDDGIGFDPRSILEPEKARLGLMGMRERAIQFGGQLTISSGPGVGTSVTVTIPLKGE